MLGGILNPRGPIGFGNFDQCPIVVPASCPTDATSGKAVPLTQADWNALFSAAGVSAKTVDQSHAMQDASGGPVATIGTNFTAYGSGLTYHDAISGWTRLGVKNPATSAAGFGLAAGTGPNPATESCLLFGYVRFDTSTGANRQAFGFSQAGTHNCRVLFLTSGGKLQVQCDGNANVSGSTDYTSTITPVVFKYDRTAGAVVCYTSSEKIVGNYGSGVTDTTGKGWPAAGSVTGARQSVFLSAMFRGAHAEWSDADVKAVLQAAGWTISW